MIRHNIGLKIFSFLLAVFIWIQSILVTDHKTTVSFPVNLTNIPAHLALKDVPRSIPFIVRGKGIDIIRLALKRSKVDIDASNLKAGTINLPLANYSFNIPEHLNIEILKPVHEEELLLQTDIYDRKIVPVELTFNSTAARNMFQSGRYRFSPETVNIYGPRRVLDTINQVRTQPLTPSMLNRSEVEIGLEQPLQSVSILESSIKLEMFDEEVIQRIFYNVPIRMEGDRQALPNRVTIKVEGHKELIRSLDQNAFKVGISPEPDARGFYQVIVETPEKVKLIDITPARVNVDG